MSVLDPLVEPSFRKDPSGRTIFRPWGPQFGTRYLLETPEQEREVRRWYTWWQMTNFFAAVVASVTAAERNDWRAWLAWLIVMGLYLWLKAYTLGKHVKRSQLKKL